MKINHALAKQRAGGITFGPAMAYDCPDIVEQVAPMSFDWVWLDTQHGQFTEATLKDALARFLPARSAPIVRVRDHASGAIGRALDMGAMGVIVPLVHDAEQAAAVVDATFYPPKGRRSAGGVRLGLIGDGFDDYTAHANEQIMLVVMVENEAAVGNVREIMRVPGIDVVLIGPGDLMLDVRARGGDAARHEELVLEVAAASKETGTAAGDVLGDAALVRRRIEQGFRFINYGLDHFVLVQGFEAIQREIAQMSG